ncbi:bifunctional oligoribonuclease/PAP phosphatase NrnA [Candidatus Babeliales bacterium]|nr:bifunctional oligoribonuclease/PAP phosphatase NrnA [Candidatus Babeliales bacterium]
MEQNSKNNIIKNGFSKKNIFHALKKIQKSKTITILTHLNPDGDAISSCTAMSHILEKKGKKVEVIYPSNPEFKLKRTSKNILINKHKQIPELLIILDTATHERCYFIDDFKNIPIINIDHHISNTINGTYNFVDKKTSSTCEIIFILLQNWNKNLIDKYTAECLLCGILYDSQIFHTQSTTSKTLAISAKLMSLGANLYKLKNEIISHKNPQFVKLWGKILSNIKITKKGNAAWTSITQQDLKKHNLKPTSLIGFNNFLSQIMGIDITILFYETENEKTKVSFRSKKTNVDKLASKFGGGGHKNAAGILSKKPIKTLIKEIIKLL